MGWITWRLSGQWRSIQIGVSENFTMRCNCAYDETHYGSWMTLYDPLQTVSTPDCPVIRPDVDQDTGRPSDSLLIRETTVAWRQRNSRVNNNCSQDGAKLSPIQQYANVSKPKCYLSMAARVKCPAGVNYVEADISLLCGTRLIAPRQPTDAWVVGHGTVLVLGHGLASGRFFSCTKAAICSFVTYSLSTYGRKWPLESALNVSRRYSFDLASPICVVIYANSSSFSSASW